MQELFVQVQQAVRLKTLQSQHQKALALKFNSTQVKHQLKINILDSLQETSKADEKVDINKAGVEELITLPGIGKTKANAIIAYREKSGSFSDIQDIMNVSGIGESLYEKIKDYIKV